MKSAVAVSAGFTGIKALGTSAPAYANQVEISADSGYGPLVSDPASIFDLPKGFSAKVISRAGEKMADGLLVPGEPDGMATFPGPKGRTIIVRNHELSPNQTDVGPYGKKYELLGNVDRKAIYDWANGKPCLGGTSTIVFDTASGEVIEQRLSLAGTIRNCAGGPTPWNSWITCEEDVRKEGDTHEDMPDQILAKDHGYNFEVPSWLDSRPAAPLPIKAMGRFNHEAIAVDPHSGVVYQTEDRGDGLIYRFIPAHIGSLLIGGRLQALAIRDAKSLDTRNWESATVETGKKLEVHWIDMDNVEAPEDDLRERGFAAGAARFARGEGMWHGNDGIYFACTNGGSAKKGQIWRYTPSPYEGTGREKDEPGKLELFVEARNGNVIDNCDNLTIAPWGDVVICEDGSGPDQFLRGITPKGIVYNIGRNAHSDSELAGVCFSPDGSTLFVNIQHNHMTLAITGPWQSLRA